MIKKKIFFRMVIIFNNDYVNLYFYDHNRHMMNTFKNMVDCTFDDVLVVVDTRVMTVKVYGVDMGVLRKFVNDVGFGACVFDLDYETDYDYFDNPVDDTRCVHVLFNQALYDLDDLA